MKCVSENNGGNYILTITRADIMRLLAVMFNSTHSVLTSSGLLLFICATSTSVGLCVKKKKTE